ncbi:MAG: hypothetical protein R3220_01975, partial [Balneolaceae bacterium]|nr:hypothetical protein [Balneolaceae bacterium]
IFGAILIVTGCKDNGTGFKGIPADDFWETAAASSQQMDEKNSGVGICITGGRWIVLIPGHSKRKDRE